MAPRLAGWNAMDVPRTSNTTMRGAYLSKEEAQLLDVPKGSPTIILGQVIMDTSGKAFAYDRQHWKFDLAEFLISARYEKPKAQ